MSDHERIWLQNARDAGRKGRLWCEVRAGFEHPEDGEPTEYVRADLFTARLAEIERLRADRDEAYVLRTRAVETAAAEIDDLRAEIKRLRAIREVSR